MRIFRKKGLASVWKRLIVDDDFRGGCKNHDFEIWVNGSFLGFEFAVEMAIIRMIANVEVRPWNEKKVLKECGNLRFSATQILRETDF